MDLLYRRYANPRDIMDEMILSGRFEEFVIYVVEADNDDKLWSIYLHKVWENISFAEFKERLQMRETKRLSEQPDEKQIEATIRDSMSILEDFTV